MLNEVEKGILEEALIVVEQGAMVRTKSVKLINRIQGRMNSRGIGAEEHNREDLVADRISNHTGAS